MEITSEVAIHAVWRDERSDCYAGGVGKQFRYLAYSADILVPGFLVETKVLVKAKSNVVTVQPIDEFAQVQEVLFQGASNC